MAILKERFDQMRFMGKMKTIEQIQRDAELTIIKQRVIHFVNAGSKRPISADEWLELKQLEKREKELKSL